MTRSHTLSGLLRILAEFACVPVAPSAGTYWSVDHAFFVSAVVFSALAHPTIPVNDISATTKVTAPRTI